MMSLRAYGIRRSVSTTAVVKAVSAGRLRDSVIRNDRGEAKIFDPDLADREWTMNTRPRGRPPVRCQHGVVGKKNCVLCRPQPKPCAHGLSMRACEACLGEARALSEGRRSRRICRRCHEPATEGVHCASHAAANREKSARAAKDLREEIARQLEGYIPTEAASAALGVGSERLLEWAREGLVPFRTTGRKGGRRWFRLDEVRAAIGRLNAINGVVYRPGSNRGRSVGIRAAERGGELHTCTSCRARLPVEEFPESSVRRSVFVCRACRRDLHAIEREQLSDAYVKDQLSKKVGLRAADIPSVLVEAHRAHLMLRRLIKDKDKGRNAG